MLISSSWTFQGIAQQQRVMWPFWNTVYSDSDLDSIYFISAGVQLTSQSVLFNCWNTIWHFFGGLITLSESSMLRNRILNSWPLKVREGQSESTWKFYSGFLMSSEISAETRKLWLVRKYSSIFFFPWLAMLQHYILFYKGKAFEVHLSLLSLCLFKAKGLIKLLVTLYLVRTPQRPKTKPWTKLCVVLVCLFRSGSAAVSSRTPTGTRPSKRTWFRIAAARSTTRTVGVTPPICSGSRWVRDGSRRGSIVQCPIWCHCTSNRCTTTKPTHAESKQSGLYKGTKNV